MNQQETVSEKTILIVDDNPDNLRVLFAYLTGAGFKVLVKKEGSSVLELAVKKQPDLILLDILMPEIDGFGVCRQLKQHRATLGIPIIFMSALTEVEHKLRGFELGAVDYIIKPFQQAEVLARVNTHLTIQRLQNQLQQKNHRLEELLEKLQTSNLHLEEANKKLEEASLTDPLTGMHNRRYLMMFLSQDLAKIHRAYDECAKKGQPPPADVDLVFLLIDMDRFKSVNDSYGHEAGDRVLIQMRDIFKRICREIDLKIRWGGEEFLLLIREANQHQAPQIAERLRAAVEAHAFDIGNGQTIQRTCSIGVAAYPFIPTAPKAVHWEQAIAIADKGLYAAKRGGRNAFVQIASTAHISSHHVFHRIGKNIESMIASREVQVLTSFADSESIMFH